MSRRVRFRCPHCFAESLSAEAPDCGCEFPKWTKMERLAVLKRHFAQPDPSEARSDYVGRRWHPHGG
jgi:hypothetical protein